MPTNSFLFFPWPYLRPLSAFSVAVPWYSAAADALGSRGSPKTRVGRVQPGEIMGTRLDSDMNDSLSVSAKVAY